MIRRAFIQMITGTSAGAVVPKITKPSHAIQRSSGSVESGVEPLPNFPLLGITRFTTGDEDHTVHLFPNRSTLDAFIFTMGASPITDDILKNLVYRNATVQLNNSSPIVEMKLTLDARIEVNNDGTVTFHQQKGLSGEDMTVTF